MFYFIEKKLFLIYYIRVIRLSQFLIKLNSIIVVLCMEGEMTISLCMIVKNEEDVLARILSQAKKFADEIIIVDTGSKDSTIEIAKKFTNKVYNFKWVGDFSKARNYSFSFATGDYIMWLDADDFILDEDVEKINKLKAGKMTADIYMFEYVLTHEADMTPIFKYMRERLFKRSKNYLWTDPVHELICLEGKIEKLDIRVYHEKIHPAPSGRNLKIYQKLKRQKIKLSARQQFYYARELMFNGYYKKAISELNKFIKRDDGWVENKIQACIDKSLCFKSLSNNEGEFESLVESFKFSVPRSEVSYRLGNYFLNLKKYDEAEYWYLQAYEKSEIVDNGAFIERDMHDFLPCLQLCYVCFLKKDIQKSFHFHQLAKSIRPNNAIVLKNENFFLNYFEKMHK